MHSMTQCIFPSALLLHAHGQTFSKW